jgi:UPF0755 protein
VAEGKILPGLLFILLLGPLLLFVVYQHQLKQPLAGLTESRVVEVAPGDTFGAVLDRLETAQIIDSVWLARLYLRLNALDNRLRSGEFELPAASTLPEVIAILCSDRRVRYRVTLPEGRTFADWRALLTGARALRLDGVDLDDRALFARIRLDRPWLGDDPEGLFYPDTYFYHRGDSEIDLLKRAHVRQVELLDSLWPARREGLPLSSPYEALILASIVEKETGHPDERARIAGVFVRRLQKGMRLQTDPTVIYGLGTRYDGNLTRRHLREATPYNTYRIKGLTPTPIAMPGRASIEATLHPQDGDELYFVARGDGSHVFSCTLAAHQQSVRRFQVQRRGDYRSDYRAGDQQPSTNEIQTP